MNGDSRIAGPDPKAVSLLTIITTNGERELPQAFLRRCVMLELPDPKPKELVEIGLKHISGGKRDRMERIADKFEGFRTRADDLRRRPPGTAEFLDAIHACEDLDIPVDDDPDSVWMRIENAILVKGTQA